MQNAHSTPPALSLLQRSDAAREGALALLFGALTALSAQIAIPLQPVPVTLQVFMVLLSGALLGPRLGLMSQLAYLLIGLAGAPVFSGGKFGPLALLGPTAGYLVAFPIAAYLAGLLAARARSFPVLAAGLIGCAVLILLTGGAWLGAWGSLTGAAGGSGLVYGLQVGALPFLALDVVKALAAACAAWPLLRTRD